MKQRGRDRLEIHVGPLGPPFGEAIARAATAAGETMSNYIRQAVLRRMTEEGVTFTPAPKRMGRPPKKGRP